MTRLNAANNAQTKLTAAIGAAVPSFYVNDGTVLPTAPFVITIENEIMLVGAKDGNLLSNVTRGYESTTAAAHSAGSTVENRFTAGMYNALVHVNDIPLDKLDATTNPTANDDSGDGYSVGSLWIDTANKAAYICLDAAMGAANWQKAAPQMGSNEIAHWKDKAAMLDPSAYVHYQSNSFSETVPAGATWYSLNLWKVKTGSTYIFQRVADINKAVILPAGTVIQADGTNTGFAYVCKPSLVISGARYAAPKDLYYERMERLKSLTQYELSCTIAASAAQYATATASFPTDFDNGLIVLASMFDVAWVILTGTSGSINLTNEISDDHAVRLAHSILIPFKRSDFQSIRIRAASELGQASGFSSLAGIGAIKYFKLPSDW